MSNQADTSAAAASADAHVKPSMLRFTIPSVFVEAQKVQKAILGEVERCGFSEQSAFAIKLALEESLINAVKHGNKFASDKSVQVEANVSREQAEIIIEDEGAGFARHDVPDPTAVENLEKCSGRGILLIEAYMDHVEWTNGGRRVRMIKKNNAE